jgi:hypothetical protein
VAPCLSKTSSIIENAFFLIVICSLEKSRVPWCHIVILKCKTASANNSIPTRNRYKQKIITLSIGNTIELNAFKISSKRKPVPHYMRLELDYIWIKVTPCTRFLEIWFNNENYHSCVSIRPDYNSTEVTKLKRQPKLNGASVNSTRKILPPNTKLYEKKSFHSIQIQYIYHEGNIFSTFRLYN